MRNARFGVRRLVPVVVVIALLALALAAATARANSPSATVSFAGTGSLVSNPGPVSVSLHYSCLPPGPGSVVVGLDEDGLPGGTLVTGLTCDGRNHSVTVTVDGPFIPGTAAGRADLTNSSGGAVASTTATINIK
jgi:hypothetical protein